MTNMVNWSVSWLSSLCTIVDTSRGLGSGPLDTDLSGQIMWLQGVCLIYYSFQLFIFPTEDRLFPPRLLFVLCHEVWI